MQKRGSARTRGITLVELLVVMVIVSISLGIVVPSMSKSYENWSLRTTGRQVIAMFRFASDTARKSGSDVAAYYLNHQFVVLRGGSVIKQLQIPGFISVRPEMPSGVVFLPTGQMVVHEPYTLETSRGRQITVETGPRPGQLTARESVR